MPSAYPADVIIGPTLLQIPAEELFFFVIQTYIVGYICVVLSVADSSLDHLPPNIAIETIAYRDILA